MNTNLLDAIALEIANQAIEAYQDNTEEAEIEPMGRDEIEYLAKRFIEKITDLSGNLKV